jgi:hypothetical protein
VINETFLGRLDTAGEAFSGAPGLTREGTWLWLMKKDGLGYLSAWIAKNGTDEVDIANTDYEALPADWKKENEGSATVAVGLTADGLRSGQKVSGSAFVESASAKVHDAWLERNGECAPPEQQLPYDQLSEPEKAKDRAFVLKALEILGVD